MRIAIILVHYHTPELLVQAVEAVLADLSVSNLQAELLVVDNGSKEKDRSTITKLPVQLITPGKNLGYAGGVNLGVANTSADFFFLMNPDVIVLPGCIISLLSVLENGASVVGPRFYWDEDKKLVLPPTEESTRSYQLLRGAAIAGATPAGWLRKRWRRHARSHWLTNSPIDSYSLSGALIAMHRDTWKKVGSFDEGFRLYYEEVDWLMRLKRHGLRACYVPHAEAIHLYNQSAAQEPLTAKWFEESSFRFSKRHYGAWFPLVQRQITRFINCLYYDKGHTSTFQHEPLPESVLPEIDLTFLGQKYDDPLWIEVSSARLGIPAAATLIQDANCSKWQLPADVWIKMQPGTYYLQVVDSKGNELAGFWFQRPEGLNESSFCSQGCDAHLVQNQYD